MIRTIVIDDEEKGLDFLCKLLQLYCPEVQICGTATSIEAGILSIHQHQPELVFLDIRMPRGTGFDILEASREVDFEVIFTTAHDNYAIKAIKFSALDYLLKPVDSEELQEAIKKVAAKRGQPKDKKPLEAFLSNIRQKNPFNQIALPTMDGMMFVKVEEIVRCRADGSYTRVYLTTRENVVISRNLREIEILLVDCGFFRVHKSHLINMNHICKYTRGSGGTVTMSDNSNVEVSKRKKEAFLGRLYE